MQLTCKKTNGTLYLHGHLTENTNLDTDLIVDPDITVISLQKLYSYSWFGLKKLVCHLENRKLQLSIRDLGPAQFRQLSFLPQIGTTVPVQTFDVDIVSDSHLSNRTITVNAEFGQMLDRSDFDDIDHETLFVGSFRHLRKIFQRTSLDSVPLSKTWLEEHRECFTFYFDYIYFTLLLTEACAYFQKATLTTVEDLVYQLTIQSRDIARAVFGLGTSEESKGGGDTSFSEIMEFSDKNFSLISEVVADFRRSLVDLKRCYQKDSLVWSDFIASLQQFCRFAERLAEISQVFDRSGEFVGTLVQKADITNDLRSFVANVDPTKIDEKAHVKLCRKLKIDCTKDSLDWTNTKREIHSRIASLNQKVTGYVIALQQFDLISQIIDHRKQEISILQGTLAEESTCQEDILLVCKTRIIDTIVGKLVTDIEKACFEFFFTGSATPKPQDAKAGEMLLF